MFPQFLERFINRTALNERAMAPAPIELPTKAEHPKAGKVVHFLRLSGRPGGGNAHQRRIYRRALNHGGNHGKGSVVLPSGL